MKTCSTCKHLDTIFCCSKLENEKDIIEIEPDYYPAGFEVKQPEIFGCTLQEEKE